MSAIDEFLEHNVQHAAEHHGEALDGPPMRLIAFVACMGAFQGEDLRDEIELETGVRPPFAMETFSDVEANVRISIERVTKCPYLVHTKVVRGFVYDVDTGRLHEVE